MSYGEAAQRLSAIPLFLRIMGPSLINDLEIERMLTFLRRAMIEEDMRKIDRWTARYNLIEVDFSDHPFDPFFNINEPDHLAEAERILHIERGAA